MSTIEQVDTKCRRRRMAAHGARGALRNGSGLSRKRWRLGRPSLRSRGDMEESDAERQARSEATTSGASSLKPKKKPSVRVPLPDQLPLETIVHDAPCVVAIRRRPPASQSAGLNASGASDRLCGF